MPTAHRTKKAKLSATLTIGALASEIKAGGHDVIDLSLGQLDFPTPKHISEAGKDAIDDGYTDYPPSQGLPELRKLISEKFGHNELPYPPDNIIVTPGAKQAVYEAVQTLVNPDDEVILLDPAWVSYESMVALAGGRTSRVDLTRHGFRLEPALDDIADVVSKRTTLLIINTPCNPTGAVYSKRALEGIRDLATDHDFAIISDEIYEQFTYDANHVSPASLDGMSERVITVNGFSKAYSMTGWRLGYLAGPDDVVDGAMKVHSHSVSCAPNFVQHAGIEALRNGTEGVERMRDQLRTHRDTIVEAFAKSGLDMTTPEGAFYLMIPVDSDDQSWCRAALRDAYVATIPGSAFGTPGYARVSYAKRPDRLKEAVNRLSENGLIG